MCVMNMQGGVLLHEAIASAPGICVFTVITPAAAFWARAAINKGNPSVQKAISLSSYHRSFDFSPSTSTSRALREEVCMVYRALFLEDWEMPA